MENLQKELKSRNNGIIFRDDLSGTNWSKVPNTLVEVGFLSNKEEDKKLFDEKNREKIASSIFKGIKSYLNNN